MDGSTIAAVATPVGRGGIGIIRLSGQKAGAIAGALFRKPENQGSRDGTGEGEACFNMLSHHMYYGHIVEPRTQRIVDEVLLVMMRAPRSYTREDVVEIHSHSGPAVLRQILELTLGQGARLAEPGEFTRRAFINGRIDLSQAEAVIDIINARTASALEMATSQLQGNMRTAVETLRLVLMEIIVAIEAETEFGDETGAQIQAHTLETKIGQQVILPLEHMLQDYDNGHLLRDGLRLVVVGRPNVGKSSLMNRLIKKERSIVTALPGTTRDSIEESLSIQGIPVVIADTAGLHSSVEPVEVLGMRKTHEYMDSADLILFMIAADEGFLTEDFEIYRQIRKKALILVINKSDLLEHGPASIPEDLRDHMQIEISAKYDRGIDNLKEGIVHFFLKDERLQVGDRTIPNLRHKGVFEKCLVDLRAAIRDLENAVPSDILVARIKAVYDGLGVVIGKKTDDSVLDRIFSQFCIGK